MIGPMSALDRAIEIVHGVGKLARAIGVEQAVVSNWRMRERPPRAPQCVAIERVTGGAVTCEELNTDEPWRRIPDKAWPNPKGRPVLDYAMRERVKEAA